MCEHFPSQKEIARLTQASRQNLNFTIQCAAIVLVLDAKRSWQKKRRRLESEAASSIREDDGEMIDEDCDRDR